MNTEERTEYITEYVYVISLSIREIQQRYGKPEFNVFKHDKVYYSKKEALKAGAQLYKNFKRKNRNKTRDLYLTAFDEFGRFSLYYIYVYENDDRKWSLINEQNWALYKVNDRF